MPHISAPFNHSIDRVLTAVVVLLGSLFLAACSGGDGINTPTNKAGPTPLIRAVRAGQTDTVRELLAAGAEIDTRDYRERSALYLAAYLDEDRTAEVRILVDHGATIDAFNKLGETPLFAAAAKGHNERLKILLAAGGDINSNRFRGRTPVFRAADHGETEAVAILLEHGADISIANNRGETPLYAAARRGHLDILRMLLAAGADINTANNGNLSPLDVAQDPDVIRLLEEQGARKNQPNSAMTGSEPAGS
jgi:ankyrin repeat protein